MPKLTYFDVSGSRGEEIRLALYLAGVSFTDERIKFADWPAHKERTLYGTIPTLELDDGTVLGQTNPTLVYLGREHGLHPRDNLLAARHEDLMGAVEDLRGHLSPTLRIRDAGEKQQAREALATGFLPRWGRAVEAQLTSLGSGPFTSGEVLHVVDLKLYMAARWLSSGGLDHIPRDIFAAYPRLSGVEQAVAHHPKIVAWLARGSAV